MNFLVLGGTQFVGRHIVEAALQRGHSVTLFNRGNSPDVFPQLETLTGDRNGDLAALEGKTWDAVLDCCGYTPQQVEASARLLKNAVKQYLFISTISVYAALLQPVDGTLIDEDAELLRLKEPTQEVTSESYGPLKVLCEEVVKRYFPDNYLLIRPGFVVGPYDHTDRFSYFPWRVAKGGEVLVPAAGEQPIQYIDARDLATFTLSALEQSLTGAYNAVIAPDSYTFDDLLETSRRLSGSDASFTRVSRAFLEEHEVNIYALLMYMPEEYMNAMRVSNKRALAAGLTPHSLTDTVAATLEYTQSFAPDYVLKSGIEPQREQELLEAFHAEMDLEEK